VQPHPSPIATAIFASLTENTGCLIGLTEAIDNIPTGARRNWKHIPQYPDALDRTPCVIDVAANLSHDPLLALLTIAGTLAR
jgi:hypothetical protein